MIRLRSNVYVLKFVATRGEMEININNDVKFSQRIFPLVKNCWQKRIQSTALLYDSKTRV